MDDQELDGLIRAAGDAARASNEAQAQSAMELAQMIRGFGERDVVDYIPNAPQLEYKPGFLAKLGAGLSGRGAEIAATYGKVAEANMNARARYDQLRVEQEGYRRLRMQNIQNMMASAMQRAGELRATKETAAINAQLDAAKAGADIKQSNAAADASRASTRYTNTLAKQLGADKTPPKPTYAAWLSDNINGSYFNAYKLAFTEGQAISGLQFDPDTRTWMPSGAKPIETIEDVDRMGRTLKGLLDSWDADPEEKKLVVDALDQAVAEHKALLAENAKASIDANRYITDEMRAASAYAKDPKPISKSLVNNLVGTYDVFSGQADVTFDEDIQPTVEAAQELQVLDTLRKTGQMSDIEYVRQAAPLTYTQEAAKLAAVNPTSRRALDKAVMLVLLGKDADFLRSLGFPEGAIKIIMEQAAKKLGADAARREVDAVRATLHNPRY